jgi:hypothetical protein
MYEEESKQKYRVDKIEVKTYCMLISSLGILHRDTVSDFINLFKIIGPGKDRLQKIW